MEVVEPQEAGVPVLKEHMHTEQWQRVSQPHHRRGKIAPPSASRGGGAQRGAGPRAPLRGYPARTRAPGAGPDLRHRLRLRSPQQLEFPVEFDDRPGPRVNIDEVAPRPPQLRSE